MPVPSASRVPNRAAFVTANCGWGRWYGDGMRPPYGHSKCHIRVERMRMTHHIGFSGRAELKSAVQMNHPSLQVRRGRTFLARVLMVPALAVAMCTAMLTLVAVSPAGAVGTTYYVAPNGTDTNTALCSANTSSNAFPTIQD